MASFDEVQDNRTRLNFDPYPSKTKFLWLLIGPSSTRGTNFGLGLHWDWEKNNGKERSIIHHFQSYHIAAIVDTLNSHT